MRWRLPRAGVGGKPHQRVDEEGNPPLRELVEHCVDRGREIRQTCSGLS